MKHKSRKKLSLLLTVIMLAGLLSACGEKTTFEYTLEMGENYVFDAVEVMGVKETEADKYVADLTTLDTTKEGTYDVIAKKDTKEYTVTYTVKDTKAPEVKLNQKYVFVSKLNEVDYDSFADTKDASKLTETLSKFKRLDDLKALSEDDVKKYTAEIVESSQEDLLNRVDDPVGTDGVYSAVYIAEDAYGHKTAKEVIVIYDTIAPMVGGVEDIPETVEVKDLEEEWTENYVDKLSFSDNCDGVISKDNLEVTMEKTDEEKHTYKVVASYTDRAGNKTSAEYFFTLKEKKKEEKPANKPADTTQGQTPSSGTTGGVTASTGSGYSMEDRDGDGYADLGKTTNFNGFIVDTEWMDPDFAKMTETLAYAGYYNVVAWNDGSYWMIVPYGEDDQGVEYMINWLAQQGLGCSSLGGGTFDKNSVAQYVYTSNVIVMP